jgi:hypothetical protein
MAIATGPVIESVSVFSPLSHGIAVVVVAKADSAKINVIAVTIKQRIKVGIT